MSNIQNACMLGLFANHNITCFIPSFYSCKFRKFRVLHLVSKNAWISLMPCLKPCQQICLQVCITFRPDCWDVKKTKIWTSETHINVFNIRSKLQNCCSSKPVCQRKLSSVQPSKKCSLSCPPLRDGLTNIVRDSLLRMRRSALSILLICNYS